jgi:hypothetical protein
MSLKVYLDARLSCLAVALPATASIQAGADG